MGLGWTVDHKKENSDHELDPPQISPTPESYQGGESPDSTLFQTISPYQSDGEGAADYGPSTPVYDEDEVERFERFNISLELPNNSILDDNDRDEDHLDNGNKDEMTADEIRTMLEDIFTSDEDM